MKGIVGVLILLIFSESGICQSTVTPLAYATAGANYIQNFDGLPSGGTFSLTGKGPVNLPAAPISAANLSGWQIMMTAGSNANAGFLPGTGSGTVSGVYSLGSTASADRALGSLASGTGIYAAGVVFTNQTGGALNTVAISFTAEQWRKGGSGNRNNWTFRYKTGSITSMDQVDLMSDSGLNFSSVISTSSAVTLNGNLAENQQTVSYTLHGINWKAGEQLLLRWDDVDETGSDDAVGMDNFSFSASLVSAAPSVSNTSVTNITTASALLSGLVNDNYANTTVAFEYDTADTFAAPVILSPSPSVVTAGTGNIIVTVNLPALLPGKTYYARIKAQNSLGSVTGSVQSFTTLIDPPAVTTLAAAFVGTNTALLGGNVVTAGGADITEKGIVWSLIPVPLITGNKIILGTGLGNFTGTITGLPQGTTIYARAYAVNAGGTAYGDTVRFSTQTTINSFTAVATKKTNASSVDFSIKTAQVISGLSASNFSVLTGGTMSASVTNIAGAGNTFTVTVATGTGDGTVQLELINDTGISPGIYNKPFFSTGFYTVDKNPPQIKNASIANKPMKTGDTVAVLIMVKPDADIYKSVTAKINGFPLASYTKKNDSTYTAYFIIASGGTDVAAAENIPVHIILKDSTGNSNTAYQEPVIQSSDPIDANKPFVVSCSNPPDKTYKLNDTLAFIVRFNENVIITTLSAVPAISITVGSKTKTASYAGGSNTNALLFRYIVQPGDVDTNGIQPAGTITLNGAEITDIAGNTAAVILPNSASTKNILVDGTVAAVTAVTVPADDMYTDGDTLYFSVIFSEKMFVNIKTDTPLLKITVGNIAKNMGYVTGSGTNEFLFRYIIQKGDLDKNGLSIGAAIVTGNSAVINYSGNPAVLTLKNTGSLSNIKIDAVGPVFTIPQKEMATICENANGSSLANYISVTDNETGEPVTWKIIQDVTHGTLFISNAGVTTNGKIISPGIVDYIPFNDHSNIDSFVVQVSDGININRKTVLLNIQPAIKNNIISAPVITCSGLALNLTGSSPAAGSGDYEYVWEMAPISDPGKFNKAPGVTNLQQYSFDQQTVSSWFRRRIISGSCVDTSNVAKITVVKNGLWTGSKSNSWHDERNWCGNLIPGITNDVYVYSNILFDPVITDTGKCNQLFIESAHLKINGILQLNGNINTEENIDCRNGTLFLTGSVPQTLSGNSFQYHAVKNIIINNQSGVFLNDSLMLTGTLLLNNGSLETKDQLHLSAGASIGPSASGTSVTGKIHVDHFIKGGKRSFRLIGHPFTNAIALQMIKDSIDITGNEGALNGFTPTETNQPSAFKYDPVQGNDSAGINAGWKAFTNTNSIDSNAWKRYEGIRLFVRGKPGQGLDGTPAGDGKNNTYLPQSVTLNFSGEVNTGEQEVALVKDVYAGYNVVGNPFVSGIDLSRVTKGSDIGNYYWIWNPGQGKLGGYTSFPFRSKNILPSFGAFIAKATGTVNSKLLFSENCKSQTPDSDSIATINLDDIFYVELRLETDSIFWDRLAILEMDSARAGADRNDAEKLMNSGVNFYSINNREKLLSVDARPVTNETIIPLGLQVDEAGEFRIRVAAVNLPLSNTLMLHDKYLDQWMPLAKDSSYSFSTTEDTASTGNYRFEIAAKKIVDTTIFQPTIIVNINPVPAKEKVTVRFVSPEKGNTYIRLLHLSGAPLKSISLGLQKDGQVTIPIGELISGIYLVEIRCGQYLSTQKIIKQ